MSASSTKFDSDEEFQNGIMESAGSKGPSRSHGPSSSKNDTLISLVKMSDTPPPWGDEFEKMISGMDFDARNAPEMMDHKFRIMRLLRKFNDPARVDEPGMNLAKLRSTGVEILKNALGNIGEGSVVEAPLYTIFGCNTFIGSSVYANHGLAIHDSAPVTIGDRCHIAPNVTIITESHGVDVANRRAGLLYARTVSIGDDCWIGSNVVVLPGVAIGKGCTIASCAVVSKDIPDFSVAAGVPARVIKKLEDPDAVVVKEVPQNGEALNGGPQNGETLGGEALNGETQNGDTQNGESQNGESQNGESQNGESQNGESQNGESQNGESQNGETQNGESQNGKSQNGETQNGETQNGESQNGESQNGESQNGESQNGETQNGESQNGKSQNGETQNGESQNGEALNGEAQNGKTQNGETQNGET